MSGIIFFGTRDLPVIKRFYLSEIGTTLWLEQEDCVILKHGNLLLGFCSRDRCDTGGIITFIYPTPQEVDRHFRRLESIAISEPEVNEKYRIYNFFAQDPDGRTIEFQAFLDRTEPFIDGEELMVTRRSIRKFSSEVVQEDVIWKILETCRFSPTSMNTDSYYFIVIRDKKKLEFLASLRGQSSDPIRKGQLAVAICSDPEKSRRHIQDGCIAAYHFLLSCWLHGLGTCWIAAMDRDDAKKRLGIPLDNYIATITPLGYPFEEPKTPERRDAEDLVRII